MFKRESSIPLFAQPANPALVFPDVVDLPGQRGAQTVYWPLAATFRHLGCCKHTTTEFSLGMAPISRSSGGAQILAASSSHHRCTSVAACRSAYDGRMSKSG